VNEHNKKVSLEKLKNFSYFDFNLTKQHEGGDLRMKHLIRFFKDEEGATAVEYAIMVALIAIVIIAMVILVGKRANNAFSKTASALEAT